MGFRMRRYLGSLPAAVLLSVLFAGVALANSDYHSTLNYNWNLWGGVRSYSGTTIGIDYWSTTIPAGRAGNQNAGLYKHNCFFFVCSDDLVGSTSGPYVGHITGSWSASSGDYRFHFWKNQDNVQIVSNDVWMWAR